MALRLLCLLAACLACASGFAAPLSRAAVQPRSSEVYCVTYGVQEMRSLKNVLYAKKCQQQRLSLVVGIFDGLAAKGA